MQRGCAENYAVALKARCGVMRGVYAPGHFHVVGSWDTNPSNGSMDDTWDPAKVRYLSESGIPDIFLALHYIQKVHLTVDTVKLNSVSNVFARES